MNRVLGLFAVVIICAQGFNASAAEPKGISRSNLSAMGLSNMKVVSDEQGAKVRGMGSHVSGRSVAFHLLFPILTHSHNNYHASGLVSNGVNGSFSGFPLLGIGAIGGGFSTAGGY